MTAAQQAYNLLNKSTAAKSESKGFNLDSLNSQSIDDLFSSYDQVQVRNGSQNLLLQRSSPGTGVVASDVNQSGVLQVVPSAAGAKLNAYEAGQAAAPPASTSSRVLLFGGLALVALVGIVLVIRHG
jgi:hypothetical protein